jgi:hypothetical protein
VNAHNSWWLVGGGVPWTPADVRPLGLLTLRAWSLLLFGAFYVATLLQLRRVESPRGVYLAAASTMFGFFALSTHMHENHLFFAVALFALAAIGEWTVRPLVGVLTGVLLANMLLHDPFLTHLARPYVPGPHLVLPQQLGIGQRLLDHLVAQGYPWTAEEIRGETSLLGLVATLVNAEVLLVSFAAWLAASSVYGGWRGFLSRDYLRLPRGFVPGALAFVVVTGAAFVRHVVRFPREHVFLLRFREAEVRAPFADGVGLSSFEIRGERRAILYAHAPAEIRYRLRVPPGARLRFGVALSPEVWSPEKGDGVEFLVRVEEEGRSRTLVSTYLDPKSRPEDRGWRDVEADLSELAGREVSLAFVTTAGPAGNNEFDWAGFSDPTWTVR